MLQRIIAYVNFYFDHYKQEDVNPNFIRFCLVYQFLLAHYLNKSATMNFLMRYWDNYKNTFASKRSFAVNHHIFSCAFNEIWDNYEKGRGKVYVFDSPFKQWSFLGNLTGLIYWFLRDFNNPPISESKI